MLEQYFSDARAIRHHREGPIGSHVDGFVGWLSGQGYARDSVRLFVAVFSDLGRWLHRRKLGARDLSSQLAGRYLRRSGSNRVRPHERAALDHILEHLRQNGIAARDDSVPDIILNDALYRVFMLRGQIVHGASTSGSKLNRQTLSDSLQFLQQFVPLAINLAIDPGLNAVWPPLCYPPTDMHDPAQLEKLAREM